MKSYPYQIVNVFAETHFGGNPLAVFPEADGLTTEQMQLIAKQFNLSETVFLFAPTEKSAVKKLRIFTPDYEMPFAGHPTLGSAFVAHKDLHLADHYQLETNAGLVTLEHQRDLITLSINKEIISELSPFSHAEFATLLNISEKDIVEARWVNTGSNQLLVKVNRAEAVKTCQIQTALFHQIVGSDRSLYIWFEENGIAKVRLFFMNGGSIAEDPGTGSAAANLGGWQILKDNFPISWQITQGDEMHRPNRLTLRVDENQTIYVGGKAILVGEGNFFIPEK